MSDDQDVWVFGYGSVMWKPEFKHVERLSAILHGYHRALCVYSILHRGTVNRPGLGLGLKPGGSCRGVAFKLQAHEVIQVLANLDERETWDGVYNRRLVPVTIPGRRVLAFTYIPRRKHGNYAGDLDLAQTAELVVQGVGISGTCVEYLEQTLSCLEQLGIQDKHLYRVLTWIDRKR